MLDLNKLESKLDKALANETADSMTQWLLKKRKMSYLTQLGVGEFEARKPIYYTFTVKKSDVFIGKETVNFQAFSDYISYPTAA